ncbi:NAD(P)-binding protein [Rhizoclosmatium globosum]|uniref:NAD(P)-binding protein n=1 Tax=Rhizoclosmatium globosum TaxID=329046 RepID=A0A1Y2BUU8_9FUNG|nr:NAD(P)-binding protein [Rhizoclosmatium globosum]|eukprot:ORY38531.1 NAD(P)-binding protein [Rhizoclosmatium globosum]
MPNYYGLQISRKDKYSHRRNQKEYPRRDVTFIELDLSDLKSIRNFVVQFKSTKKPIHILMNNAGIMALDTFALSKNDVEMQLATNHLGPFYLTSLLLPIIKETATSSGTARIVNLSSAAHSYTYKLGIDFENINNAEKYSAWSAYGQSKLANILFSNELQKRLEESGVSNVFVNSCIPESFQPTWPVTSHCHGLLLQLLVLLPRLLLGVRLHRFIAQLQMI